ncbi:MAG: N-acyl homoserine lactonase family protein [Alphaproteobacteria bacterium]|nr:N-acyl homoserine lactonase family protein [Alphaproteobacteria bacterium]
MAEPEYEIYAIKYAERVGTRGATFMDGDPHDAPIAMDYFVWVLKSPERNIVVDVGMNRAEGEKRKRTFLRCPIESLKLVGVDPADVEDVVISHMHYDHAGNLELFPKARFHIQDTEMAYVTGRAMTHKRLRHSFCLSDVVQMVTMVYGDRVVFHDGDAKIFPGIDVHAIPGHSRGLQALTVNTARGTVVVASDAAHYYECVTDESLFMTHENLYDLLEGYRKVRRLAPSDDHIIPGHDPEVLKRYPAASAELEGIVARVDVSPRHTA